MSFVDLLDPFNLITSPCPHASLVIFTTNLVVVAAVTNASLFTETTLKDHPPLALPEITVGRLNLGPPYLLECVISSGRRAIANENSVVASNT